MKFKMNYAKLDRMIFPTVRSTQYMGKHGLELGDVDEVYVSNTKIGTAKLIAYEDKKIQDFPIAFMRYDVAPLHINTAEDFVEILNSFLPANWRGNRVTTMKRVLWWRWEELEDE